MATLDQFTKEDRSDPNRDDIPTGILRQRRNLLIISFILLAIYIAGLKFEFSSIEAFGITATLKHPEVIEDFWFLWGFWFYFLGRYIQYLNFYKSYSEIKNSWEDSLQRQYTKFFSRKVTEKFPELINSEREYQIFPDRISHSLWNG